MLYILFISIWVMCTQDCSSFVFQPCETVQVLNNFVSSLQWLHWQTLFLSHTWRDASSKGWLPRLPGQMLLGCVPHTLWRCTASWLCTAVLPIALSPSSVSVSGARERGRTIEANTVCIDFWQHESKIDVLSLSYNRKTIAVCSVCGWTTARVSWWFVHGK